jgi:hypothetical protein
MTHQMVERELDRVESVHNIDLQRQAPETPIIDEEYYPQFEESVRKEAQSMADYYQIFYCLERSIRQIVTGKLSAEKGANWWDTCVPEQIRKNASENLQREVDLGVTPRSPEEIDYTTFGELGEIVKTNWQSFSDIFNSQKAFARIMASLNVLRGPIAHCCQLAPDEILRLKVTVRDWFRLME